jgi:hypothetical protein
MSNLSHVKIDESDSRFRKLKENFIKEITERFTCDDYEAIAKYFLL